MVEGRDKQDYEPERAIYIDKIKLWTTGEEIKSACCDREAMSAVTFFMRYKRYGLPFFGKNWAEMPNNTIEILDVLENVHMIYNPPQRLI